MQFEIPLHVPSEFLKDSVLWLERIAVPGGGIFPHVQTELSRKVRCERRLTGSSALISSHCARH